MYSLFENVLRMKTIETRVDVEFLVNAFYARIREDDMLGPIFNKHIADDQWPAHLKKLADFWETNLFGIPKFRGNPPAAHIKVDKNLNHSITQDHFGRWLQIWFATINDLFEGERAEMAKQRARIMSTGQFMAIWHARPENS